MCFRGEEIFLNCTSHFLEFAEWVYGLSRAKSPNRIPRFTTDRRKEAEDAESRGPTDLATALLA